VPGTPYRQIVLSAVPTLLSSQDRDPASPTFGCFDRQYWAWANKDFANADLQRGVYILARLYRWQDDDNPYFDNEHVRSWIEAGIEFLCRIQHGNGAFDQWYPLERSVGTTGFVTGPVVDALELLGDDMSGALRSRACEMLRRAGRLLLTQGEGHGFISNHQAGAALSLYRLYELLGDDRYKDRSSELIDAVARHQSEEGWFCEYDGADPGYETLGIAYLASLWQRSGNPRLFEMLQRSVDFLRYFIHPNGTLGGEYGSRSTELYYPSGIEALAPRCAEARSIATDLRQRVGQGRLTDVANCDVPNFVPLLSSYVSAMIDATHLEPAPSLPCAAEPFTRHFVKAGLYVRKTTSYYSVVGLSKGGTLRLHDSQGGNCIHIDAGLVALSDRGPERSTQILEHDRRCTVTDTILSVDAPFYVCSGWRRMTPVDFTGLRLFTHSIGRWGALGEWLKRFLARRLISGRKRTDLTLTRTIEFQQECVTVKDRIEGTGHGIAWIQRGVKFCAVFMGSARYFSVQELEIQAPPPDRVSWNGKTPTSTEYVVERRDGVWLMRAPIDAGES